MPCGSHRNRLRFRWLLAICAFLAPVTFQSCFTGIESTPKISESDLRRESRASRPEVTYLDGITGEPPSLWHAGKFWTVTDPRSERVFGINLDGSEISFTGISEVVSITGSPEAIISFDSPAGRVSYRTDISADSLMRRRDFAIPYAVENSVVDAVRSRLAGNRYYITTSLWNDASGNSVRGLKYIPVEVVDVSAGRGVYPLRLSLSYEVPVAGVKSAPGHVKPGDSTHRYFNLAMAAPGSVGGATHAFPDFFSLTDPRKRYPKIEDKAWANIIAGRVGEGMTRDECRLALGSPANISRHAGYSELREIWTYDEGIRLVFIDGLLTSAYR